MSRTRATRVCREAPAAWRSLTSWHSLIRQAGQADAAWPSRLDLAQCSTMLVAKPGRCDPQAGDMTSRPAVHELALRYPASILMRN